MAYQALYRKFRPETFSDVYGQDAIVTTLKNQIKTNRIGHAYLFCGTRGTGKTTVAKIFARAVNCENPKEDGSPCMECEICKGLKDGTLMNVIEIDAASNNGVENVRTIIDEVSYSPTKGRYKVYIIDEVHMLSSGAFNALLKTLEEPPEYVIFILATTEASKILPTILSRCQRYDFRRMSIDTMVKRMKTLADKESINAEDRALKFIARTADGSMRDALSLLDQCLAFNYGKELTYDRALDVLGAVDASVYVDFMDKIMKEDLSGAIGILDENIMRGREIGTFVNDLVWHMRNMLLVSTADDSSADIADVLGVSTDTLEQIRQSAKKTDPETLMRYIRIFSELSGQIR
ncbi:MAG: DNA polymerase III subunit gamma/tau, partial [Lachnospiraceae bacterium]|nr:DNA polymerase III subunit gamma/tau [Lachnospiraceae bacterium]